MTRVIFDHVTKCFGSTVAVHDLNMDIESGECIVLVGPSGCGKATSLRMLAGLETITSGDPAQLDGANRLQSLIYIILPLSYPILAVVFLLSLITIFNEFPVASILLFQEENLTLAVGLRFFSKIKIFFGEILLQQRFWVELRSP